MCKNLLKCAGSSGWLFCTGRNELSDRRKILCFIGKYALITDREAVVLGSQVAALQIKRHAVELMAAICPNQGDFASISLPTHAAPSPQVQSEALRPGCLFSDLECRQ